MIKKTYEKVVTMRRMIDILGEDEKTSLLLERLRRTKKNKEFLENLNQGE